MLKMDSPLFLCVCRRRTEPMMKRSQADAQTYNEVVEAPEIVKINLSRIKVACFCAVVFEIVNILNPAFWRQPVLWSGALYFILTSVMFLLYICVYKRGKEYKNPERLYLIYWISFSIGMFPFLVRDAQLYALPLNCVLLGGIMICAPLFAPRSLTIVYSVVTAVNLLAAFYVGDVPRFYYLQLLMINICGYFMARKLHANYFRLVSQQKQHYEALLQSQQDKRALEIDLEKERIINSEKSKFLSQMSHDLRTPLNAIIGSTRLALGEEPLSVNVRKYLSEIDRSSGYLLALVSDVLDMARIDGGKMVLHPEPYVLPSQG